MDKKAFQKAGHLFNFINRIGYTYKDKYLKEKGISRGQTPYLMELSHQDGVTQEYLAQRVMIDKSTVARSIQKLEANGLVYREQNPKDKRENLVFLTPLGREIHPLVHTLSGQWLEAVSVDLSTEELEHFLYCLEKMATVAKAYRNNQEDD